MATIGMIAARQVCRNSTITSTTSSTASKIVSTTASTDCWMNCVGEVLGKRRGRRADAVAGGKRVRARTLEHGERDRGIAPEIGGRGIVLAGQFDARHVLDAHDRRRRLLDDDVGEFGRIGQPAQRSHRHLEGELVLHRRLVEDARSDLDILPEQRLRYVLRGQVQRLQAVGIEPDLHGEVARAEHGDRAHAFEPRQHVLDLQVGVVRQEDRIARLVGREQVHHHQDVGRGLGDGDADLLHGERQARIGDGDAVLHLHLGDVEIDADIEGDGDGEAAVGAGIGGEVEHPLHAVHLLLDRGDHRLRHRLRARARILPGDVDDGRGDLRILRDRQAREGDAAEDDEDDGDDGGEDRPVDEEMGNPHGANPGYFCAEPAEAPGTAPTCGCTLMPARARIRPSTITRSSGPSPLFITRSPSASWPSVT
jgi:hypothetical protein